jgi:hypothetical protein
MKAETSPVNNSEENGIVETKNYENDGIGSVQSEMKTLGIMNNDVRKKKI